MITLVTGATGLVGNNVVRLLLERGQSVRVMARQSSDPRPLEGLDIEIVRGDLRNADEVSTACTGVDTVIHSAAHIHIGWTQLELSREINVQGTQNVVDAARRAGARMVHVSSVDTLSPSQPDKPADEETPGEKVACTYVVTKREAEKTVLEHAENGLNAVVVNPGFMLGPWDWKPSSGRMLLEVAKRFTPIAPVGGVSLCDVRDVAAGILSAASQGQVGRRYILAGHNMSYSEAWSLFSQVAGGKGPTFKMGPLIRVLVGSFGDFWAKMSGREGDVNSAGIKMSSLHHYYSSARANAELGYHCRPASESIEAAWRWFVDYGYV